MMRRTSHAIPVILGLALAAVGSSCTTTGPAGVYADIQYAVRCEAMGMCPGTVMRDINGFNGTDGLRVSCNVVETATQRILSFSATSRSTFGMSVMNATFARGGGSPSGAGCVVEVQDSPNTFRGDCGGAPPSAVQPCQISSVVFTREAETGSSLITGQMICASLPNRADATILREVTSAGSAAAPLTFNLYDCTGYNPD